MGTSKLLSWSVFKAHIHDNDDDEEQEEGFLLEPVHKIMLTFAKSFSVLLSNFFLLFLGFLSKLIIRFLVHQNDLGCSVELDPDGFSQTENFRYFFDFQLQSSTEQELEEDEEEKFMAFSGNEISDDFLEQSENMEIFENPDDFDVFTISCIEAPLFPAASHGNETNEQDGDEEEIVHSPRKFLPFSGNEISDGFLEQSENMEIFANPDDFDVLTVSCEEAPLYPADSNENDTNEQDLVGMIKNREKTEENNCFSGKEELGQTDQEIEADDVYILTKLDEESCRQDQNPFPKWEFEQEEEEEDEEDILMEHKELIEQMKMEAKTARGGGLPTILEEYETPMKIADDLKPLKFEEERLQYKDHMEEIQKVYRCYSEKMRKLAILNYQTVQAIGFLQMKNPSRHFSSNFKSPSSTIKSLIIPSRWPNKLRRIYATDPTVKSMAKLHRELETIYVGQACLSWEILKWQYEKAIELSKNDNVIDSQQQKTYNQTACEFQQFQVLVQRFVENEAFQTGTRIQNYARERSSIRALLHVPVVKDDCVKEMKMNQSECSRISVGELIDILEESMRVFWEFIRADKDGSFLVRMHQTGVDHQLGLLEELNTTLQKKNRRLKDIVRSRKCMVKKLIQKQKFEEVRVVDCNQLSAQVELKMVGRVLGMSKGLTIDQLAWCQKKLNKVTFPNGKLQLEPTFLLFPAA